MKYIKQQAKHLDTWTNSAILTEVSLDTARYGLKDNRDDTPVVTIQLTDCRGRVILDDFGETKSDQLNKIDRMISELLDLRTYTEQAWRAYRDYWANRVGTPAEPTDEK
jgi:hypothetical protein